MHGSSSGWGSIGGCRTRFTGDRYTLGGWHNDGLLCMH